VFKQRALSAIIIVAAAVVPAVLGHPVLAIGIAVLAGLGIIEFCRAMRDGNSSNASPDPTIPVILSATLILSIGFGASAIVIAAIIALGLLVIVSAGILRQDYTGSTRSWAYAVAGTAYIAIPLAHVPALRDLEASDVAAWIDAVNDWALTSHPAAGLAWLVLIVSITWITDTAAYLGGRALGRNKLTPRLSPGKTIEGAVLGSVFGALTGGVAVALLGLPLPVYAGIGIGLVLSVVGQVGDLAESMIKRDIGVKDMGTLIPGHGGILDRIDALLFTLPVGYYLVRLAVEINWP
jgi:phosphatidate cytidylyltransferase